MADSPTSSVTGPALIPLGDHAGKPAIPLSRPVIVIGSRNNARIHLISSTVSKAHALMVNNYGRLYIRDLASRSGVFVNGEKVSDHNLEDGDELRLGRFKFRYVAGRASRSRHEAAPPSKLQVDGERIAIPIDQRVMLIGRRKTCDIHLLEESCSTAHAVVFEMNGQRYIRDLGSRSGTRVNGKSVHQQQIEINDRINIGDTLMTYAAAVEIAPEEIEAPAIEIPQLDDELELSLPELPTEEPVGLAEAELELELEPDKLLAITPETDELELPPLEMAAEEMAVTEKPLLELSQTPDALDPSETLSLDAEDFVTPVEPPQEGDLLPRRGWRPSPSSIDEHLDEPSENKPPESKPPENKPLELELSQPAAEAPAESVIEELIAPEVAEAAPADETAAAEELALAFDEPAIREEMPFIAPHEELPVVEAPSAVFDQDTLEAALKDDQPVSREIAEVIGEAEPTSETVFEAQIAEQPIAPEIDAPLELASAESLTDSSFDRDVTEFAGSTAGEIVEPDTTTSSRDVSGASDQEIDLDALTDITEPAVDLESTTAESTTAEPTSTLAEVSEAESVDAIVDAIVEPDATLDTEVEVEHEAAAPAEIDADALALDELTRDLEPHEPTTVAEIPEPELLPVEPTAPVAGELPEWVTEGANRDNVLGGMPISLPEPPPASFADLPIEPAAAAIADSAITDSKPEVEAVNALIDEIIAPDARQVTPDSVEMNPTSEVESPAHDSTDTITDVVAPSAEVEAKLPEVPAMKIPPRPSRQSRRGRKRRDQRDNDSETARSRFTGDLIPPFVPGSGENGRIDGLAMPPVREADVFSQMDSGAGTADPFGAPPDTSNESSQTVEEEREIDSPPRKRRATPSGQTTPADIFWTGPAIGTEPVINAELSEEVSDDEPRPRPRVRPAVPEFEAARRPAVHYSDTPIDAIADRKRKLRRIPFLIAGMVLALVGSVTAVWLFGAPRSLSQLSINFTNLSTLTQQERRDFQKQQEDVLKNDATRRVAKRKLTELNPEVKAGFLDDTTQYFAAATSLSWRDSQKGPLMIQRIGTDVDDDKFRLRAIGRALIEANQPRVDDARSTRGKYQELLDDIRRSEQQQAELKLRIDKLKLIGDSRPSATMIADLEKEVGVLEKAWNESVASVKNSQAELERLKTLAPGAADVPGAADPAASDEKIQQLSADAEALQKKIGLAREQRATQAEAARTALDVSMEEFQKQIAAARDLMKDSPELAQYISGAQRLQEQTRSLIDDFIRRQQQQYARLTDLKDSLSEQMEKRRAEQLGGDEELRKLTDRLEIARRQYNAAIGGGMKEPSEEKLAEIKLLESMIKAREEMLPKDPFFVAAIDKLQQIIDSQQKDIETDRTKTDQMLAQLQTAFTSQETIEKLPAEQKSLATNLEKRLEDINLARKTYNEQVSATSAEDDEVVKEMRARLATIQTSIESQKKRLADDSREMLAAQVQEQRDKQLATKLQELANLQTLETESKDRYFARNKDLMDAKNQVTSAKEATDQLIELQNQKDTVDRQHKLALDNIENRKRAAERAVEPLPIEDKDMVVSADRDNRAIYSVVIGGVLLIGFIIPILLTLQSAAQSLSVASLPLAPSNGAADALLGAMASNTNDQNSDGSHEGTEEDEQPLVI